MAVIHLLVSVMDRVSCVDGLTLGVYRFLLADHEIHMAEGHVLRVCAILQKHLRRDVICNLLG